MKRAILLLVTVFLSICMAHSQEQFEKLSPAKDFKSGMFVKVADTWKHDLHGAFFSYPDVTVKKNKIKKKYTSLDKLRARVFKITETFVPRNVRGITPILVLEDMETGEVLYFYNPGYSYHNTFLVYDEEFARTTRDEERYFLSLKKSLRTDLVFSRSVDNIDKIIWIASPSDVLKISKSINKNNEASYSLILETSSPYLNETEMRGIKILFEDDTLWEDNGSISVRSRKSQDNWVYFGLIILTQSELRFLCEKKIKEFRLDFYNQKVPDDLSEIFPEYVKAIIFQE